MPLLEKPLLHNLLLLRNRLPSVVPRRHILPAGNLKNNPSIPVFGQVIMARPLRHVVDHLLREGVVDSEAVVFLLKPWDLVGVAAGVVVAFVEDFFCRRGRCLRRRGGG